MKIQTHNWLPYALAVALFTALCLALFAPMLEGERLTAHDTVQYVGMQRDMEQHLEQYGENPYWAGRMFGGMPSDQIWSSPTGTNYVGVLANTIWPVPYPLGAILLAMIAFWAMCLLMGFAPWPSVVPALGYGLSTYFFILIGAGHVTKLVSLAWAPLVMGGIFYAFRKDRWLGAAITAAAASRLIAENHYQIVYYFALIVIALWISRLIVAIRDKQLPRFARTTGALALAGLLAFGSNFGQLVGTQRYAGQTMRGGSELTPAPGEERQVGAEGLSLDYATMWSYGIDETLNLLIPDAKGGASQRGFRADGPVAEALGQYGARQLAPQLSGYWGTQPGTSGPVYIGAVVLLLAVAGLFALRGRCKWWVVAISLVAILLAWGSHFMGFTEFFYYHFPYYNKFRTVSMILVIVEWTAPLLGAMFLYTIWRGEDDRRKMRRAVLCALYVLGGLTLFVALFGGMLWSFASASDLPILENIALRSGFPRDQAQLFAQQIAGEMQLERAMMLRGDAWRTLLFLSLTAGTLLLWLSGRLKRGWAVAVLAGLVMADMIPVNARFFPRSSFGVPHRAAEQSVQPSEADLLILRDTTPGYRVANLTVGTFQDATTSYFHRSIGGYHAAKLQRYQDLIDRHLAPGNMQVYNMLNARWFIQPGSDGRPQAQLNPDANGAAWLVDTLLWAASPDEEIDVLNRIDTKTIAVADRRFEVQAGAFAAPDSTASITLVDYRVNRLTYKYSSAHPSLAVFSEIYYPDRWAATIDGAPLDYFRADYLLRAAVLPAGDHTIVFVVVTPELARNRSIMLISSLLILLGLAGAIVIPNYCCKRHGTGQ